MPEVEEVFRLATNKVKPDPNALERQQRRQRSAARSSRVRVYLAVAAVIAAVAVGAVAVLEAVNSHDKISVDNGERHARPADVHQTPSGGGGRAVST